MVDNKHKVNCVTLYLFVRLIYVSVWLIIVTALLSDQLPTLLKEKNRTLTHVLDTGKDEKKAEALENELQDLYEEVSEQVKKKSKRSDDSEEERSAFNAAMERYKKKSKELEKLEQQIADKGKRLFDCMQYIESFKSLKSSCVDFSEKLWLSLVDHVTVPESREKTLVLHLRSGKVMHA